MFLYEDILLKESEQRKKAILLSIKRLNPNIKSWYSIKLKSAYGILKTIYTFIGSNLRKNNVDKNFVRNLEIKNSPKCLKNKNKMIEMNVIELSNNIN